MILSSCSSAQPKGDVAVPEVIPETIEMSDEYKEDIKKDLAELQSIKPVKYNVSSGDSFNIYVYDEDELTTENAIVKADGTITVKLAGDVLVEKKTIEEAQKTIEEALRKFIREPKVSMIPKEIKSARFTIIGKVNKPGSFAIDNNMRILDAIALSGGFTTGIFKNNTVEMADLEHSFISRKGRLLPINFVDLVQKGNQAYNVPLSDGDYIYISSAMNKEIFILGEIQAPGFYGYNEGHTLIQLIAKAKGLLDTATSQVIIIRNGLVNPVIYSVNVSKVLKGQAKDVRLQPDDIVYVPKSIMGQWNKILNLLLPSIQTLQTGLLMQNLVK
jgi:polysaccharide export outer membrane protein